MPDLVAVGYDDTTTALNAMDEVERLSSHFRLQPDAVAAITRADDGRFRTFTNQHLVGQSATWGMFWGAFFVVLFGPVLGLALGAVFGAITGSIAQMNRDFQERVRELMQPGASSLFLIVAEQTTDPLLVKLSRFNGIVLKATLSTKDEADLQIALHGPRMLSIYRPAGKN